MAEKFYDLSPYNYADDNPVNNIDPDGMQTRPSRLAHIRSNGTPPSTRRITTYKPSTGGNMRQVSQYSRNTNPASYFTTYEMDASILSPQLTTNNRRGQSLSSGINFADAIVTNIKDTFMGANGSSKTNSGTIVSFANPESQQAFNKIQGAYDKALNGAIGKLDKPEAPGPNATPQEMQQYKTEMARYNLQVEIVKSEMGPSPTQQVINYVREHEKDYKKDVRVENLPEIRPANR